MIEAIRRECLRLVGHIDWLLIAAFIPLVAAGLVTMDSFVGENLFFERQIWWAGGSLVVLVCTSFFDFRFLRRTGVLVVLYGATIAILLFLALFGAITKGAQSWLDFGAFNVQPSDPAKLVLIALLAKYFSRRHIEIANIRHILISGAYAFVLCAFVFLQSDFGSAVILFAIWFGMVLVSGISKKHLTAVFATGIAACLILWGFVFAEYQKARIVSFLNPLADIQGTGYNAYQATIAVGSGQFFGKGVGFGTQSKLQFLPEYETDFIFAAFAEEWGFVGVILMLSLFGVLMWRILENARHGATNFEVLFGVGLAVMIMSHLVIHIGMNLGLLPVTGTPLPLVSYGGSHLLTEALGIGILIAMRRYARTTYRDEAMDAYAEVGTGASLEGLISKE
jgi:rod shape determining protein RodA